MRVKERSLLENCIERGVALGVNRAYKHTDTPSRMEIADSVDREVWVAIDEFFSFDSEDDEHD